LVFNEMEKNLYLYNTSSRSKEFFQPLHENVGVYCCGPTVYNFAHIGNLRTYVFEDVLVRTLRALQYSVIHVMNITDVGHLTSDEDTGDDKMEKGALREGKTVWDIAAFYSEAFKRNMADLNILPPDRWPKATDHIPGMISLIQKLEKLGFTYTTNDGVYFETEKFPAYPDFARIDVRNLKAGNRVDMGEKRAVTDFALWKFSPKDKQRQMEWDSPWGKGFPGWHIECSVMSLAYLSQPIDIHCGGVDHIRVHHTNEITQTEAATGKSYVRYWLHGEFLNIDKGKMAKSGENFITLDSIKNAGIDPLAFRSFCFSAHYRSPLVFSWEGLSAAEQGLKHLKKIISSETEQPRSDTTVKSEEIDRLLFPFWEALCDDFNMPVAMAEVWNLLRDRRASAGEKFRAIEQANGIMGLDLLKQDRIVPVVKNIESGDERISFISPKDIDPNTIQSIVAKIKERKKAKKEKDFARADALRKELMENGIEISDLPGGNIECKVRS
jgi:cysteinyl-tRNA synthetase